MSIYNAFHAILYFQNSINRGKWNLLGISLKSIPQNIVLFPDTVKCCLQSSNSESLVANIVTFNVVTIKHKLSKLLLEYKVNL